MSENSRNNGRIFNFPLSFPYQVCLRERPPLASSSSSTADTESGEEEEEEEKGSLAREARGKGRREGCLAAWRRHGSLPSLSAAAARRPPLAAAFGYYYCSEGKPPLARRGDKGKDWLGRLSLSPPSCCSPVVAVSRPERPDRENEPTSRQMTARRCSGNCTVGLFFVALLWEEGNEGRTCDRCFFLLLLLRK